MPGKDKRRGKGGKYKRGGRREEEGTRLSKQDIEFLVARYNI